MPTSVSNPNEKKKKELRGTAGFKLSFELFAATLPLLAYCVTLTRTTSY